ncbi:XRE family transcriptional regulator [Paracoccus sp. S-4012]|uniref:helix-turn-helix transcriptional regulator n=1 Tax=Paracoccus sp. S-4012 TaxID=2665648 RepID=UPI0012AEF803|nr:helix-turn-helix transcriptional regulator [Paracoccus sp. S-4012]MRX50444.1 XRE family transcriptional regulator [Paracoccus sp. S-4012]
MTKPFHNTPAANLLRERIRDLQGRKTQSEIAREAGFNNANFVSLLKNGSSKIPLDRVPDLARAIEVDPALLMRLSLDQSIGPAGAAAVISIFGTPISKNELAWLSEIRDASDNSDPSLTTKARAVIRAFFKKMS